MILFFLQPQNSWSKITCYVFVSQKARVQDLGSSYFRTVYTYFLLSSQMFCAHLSPIYLTDSSASCITLLQNAAISSLPFPSPPVPSSSPPLPSPPLIYIFPFHCNNKDIMSVAKFGNKCKLPLCLSDKMKNKVISNLPRLS